MIYSMTGFARAQTFGEWGTATSELRSVNHRYLEIVVRLPDILHELESAIRERIRHFIKRGKVECIIRFQPSGVSARGLNVNFALVEQLAGAHEDIAEKLSLTSALNPTTLLQWPGVLSMAEMDLEMIQDKLLPLLEKALVDLVEVREREGEEIKALFWARLDLMKKEVEKVRDRLPEVMSLLREKWHRRFE